MWRTILQINGKPSSIANSNRILSHLSLISQYIIIIIIVQNGQLSVLFQSCVIAPYKAFNTFESIDFILLIFRVPVRTYIRGQSFVKHSNVIALQASHAPLALPTAQNLNGWNMNADHTPDYRYFTCHSQHSPNMWMAKQLNHRVIAEMLHERCGNRLNDPVSFRRHFSR